MNREELRVVEFIVIEKSKPKKGKKTQKKEVKKIGLFHLWSAAGKGKEKFTGLIEDATDGKLLEVSFKDIRFLSDDEIDELTDAVITEAEELLNELEEAAEIAEAVTETPAEEAATTEETPADAPVAEAKPKRTRKS